MSFNNMQINDEKNEIEDKDKLLDENNQFKENY